MVQINLVSRIAGDKNSFFDLVFIAYKLKLDGYNGFRILFIGEIESPSIYQNIIRMAGLLDVGEHIDFTKKSIPLARLPENIKDGYFLNYSVGKFIGYSGIESIANGLKAIFVNGDKSLEDDVSDYINVCRNIPDLIEFIKILINDKVNADKQIISNNLEMSSDFKLTEPDTAFLLSMMKA
jgi:hypothetical protein